MLLVVDIESYIYRACTACKTLINVPGYSPDTRANPNIYVEAYDIRRGMDYIANFIEGLKAKFLTNDVILVVGDKENWRKKYYPDYKANRKDKEKPPMYDIIRAELYNNYEVVSLLNLEADDTCRIIYEDNQNYPVKKVLVSIDKDFHSFPCELYDPLHDEQFIINKPTADYNLMKQVIMGDKTDNYNGIEGYGEVKATKFLDDEPRTFDDVQQLFKEQGQAKDFKINLNLASMVSIDRYNFNTGEVKVL